MFHMLTQKKVLQTNVLSLDRSWKISLCFNIKQNGNSIVSSILNRKFLWHSLFRISAQVWHDNCAYGWWISEFQGAQGVFLSCMVGLQAPGKYRNGELLGEIEGGERYDERKRARKWKRFLNLWGILRHGRLLAGKGKSLPVLQEFPMAPPLVVG